MQLTTLILYAFFILACFHFILAIRVSIQVLGLKEDVLNFRKHGFSLVIAAHNEATNLQELIPALLAQNYEDYEITVALDRCTDESKSVLQKYHDQRLRFIEIDRVPDDFHGKKYAITQAIKTASKEWILLTDADCRPASAEWIARFNERIGAQTEIIIGFGPYLSLKNLLSSLIHYETAQTAMNYAFKAIRGKAYMGVGRNLAYKKSLFMKVGGFEEFRRITGGDDDLFVQYNASKSNTEIVISPESLTYSTPKRKWIEYIRQKTRHLSVGKYYLTNIKTSHIVNNTIHLLLWLSFLYLIINYPFPYRIIGVFSVLIMVKGYFFVKSAKKTGSDCSVLIYPIVDFLYALFLPLIGIRAFLVKKIKWN